MTKKETSADWKHQVARAERKSRLARMKGSDGHKKKIESHSIWKRVVLAFLAVLAVLGLLVWIVSSAGILTRSVTALTVGSRKLTAADLNMVMGNMTASEQLGLAFTDEFQKVLDQESQMGPGSTVREEFINQILPSITFMYCALNEIESEGFSPDENQLAEMDRNARSLEEQFTQLAMNHGQSVSSLVKLYYGPGASLRLIERDLRNSMLINYYEEAIREEADLSDEKVEEFYQEHRDKLDVYSYYSYVFKIKTDEDATAEERKEALADLVETVNLALGDLGEFTFEEAILKYVDDEEAEFIEENPGSLVFKKEAAGRISSAVLDFLKDDSRKEGDAKVIEGTNSVTLVQFIGRSRDDFRPYSVRHILIRNPENDPDEKTDGELKKEAEAVLQQYLDGDRTEASFVKLVIQHSDDPGSKAAGGLYRDVASGAMVREFESWCTEDGRKKGDTGIVKTVHGYHIMYFEGYGDEPELPDRIRESLKEIHLNEWMGEVTRDVEVKRHPFGMKFVGKKDFFSALFGRPPAEPKEIVPELTPAG
ncbi:MAG TPA: peptidylprolyl isomerase [Bacillota bacterium]|jgi:parvulin-like peptidyl-prolyl isomerase|nr:hypothetical protein [Fastidiosipila sp.]HPX93661.1 peptidylprolyl isomerase [Bacillota bacterium]HQB81560.1 peptidylprolyl isomerase [Bacillota bacterium]